MSYSPTYPLKHTSTWTYQQLMKELLDIWGCLGMPGSQDAASASGSETAEVATTPAAPPWGKPQGVGVTKGETLGKMAENTSPQVEGMEPENDGFPSSESPLPGTFLFSGSMWSFRRVHEIHEVSLFSSFFDLNPCRSGVIIEAPYV